MKNQYVGDINDFRKYGLLRLLTAYGKIRTAVCWMLTLDDNRTDGNSIEYLNQSKYWRDFDPPLFDLLRDKVYLQRNRNVHVIETSDVLPSTKFFSSLLPDEGCGRLKYFETFKEVAKDHELIFFDPDNGIEVQSKKYGSKDSSKYVYRKELIEFYFSGHSLLIYQHFPRVKRDLFIKKISDDLMVETRAEEVHCFYTSRVLFLLIPQKRHSVFFKKRIREVRRKWGEQIKFMKKIKYPKQLIFEYDHVP